jgi:hypothetical protein
MPTRLHIVLLLGILNIGRSASGCDAGTYCYAADGINACSECLDCAAHTYNPYPDQGACLLCSDASGDQVNIGQTTCELCPANSAATANKPCTCLGHVKGQQRYMIQSGSTRECVEYPTQCNFETEYRNPVDNACTTKDPCNRDKEYIMTPGTASTATLCATMCEVTDAHYQQVAGHIDSARNLVTLRVCALRSICTPTTEYEYMDSVKEFNVRITDRLCRELTECLVDLEYEEQVPQYNSDRKCTAITPCVAATQYTYQLATVTTQTSCMPKLFCTVSQYLISSTSEATLTSAGQNNICANRTTCGTGWGLSSRGNQSTDDVCAECAIGSIYNNGLECTLCSDVSAPYHTYQSEPGQTNCTRCTDCTEGEAIITPCNNTHDTICGICPDSWKYNKLTHRCTPCATGYYMKQGLHQTFHQLDNTVCLPCAANTYCVGWTSYETCPNPVAFQRETLVFLPSSVPNSSRASDCNCFIAGGFTGHGGSIFGCQPCANGSYMPPTSAITLDDRFSPTSRVCTPCPLGEFAAQTTLRDELHCGTAIINTPDGAQMSLQNVSTCLVTVGARYCTPCASGRTTRQLGSHDLSQCTRCNATSYWLQDTQKCKNCTTVCPSNFYLTGKCTDSSDTVCTPCLADNDCKAPGYYHGGCPNLQDVADPSNSCVACTDKPLENAVYIVNSHTLNTKHHCAWTCQAGFYATTPINAPKQCRKCTSFRSSLDDSLNTTACPVGNMFIPCSADSDASCHRICNNTTKPTFRAVYIPIEPRCQWQCEDGLTEWISAAGLRFCRATGI